MIRISLALAIALMPTLSFAQDARSIEAATNMIIELTDAVCVEVSTEGSGSRSSIEGGADAALGRLAKRLFDLGIEGAGTLTESEFSNVLRSDLAAELKDNRRCREMVFNAVFARVFGDAPEVVLSDAQQESLAGNVRPHNLNVVQSEDIFAMSPGDTVGIKSITTPFSITAIKPHSTSPYVNYSWTDARNASSASSYQYQSQPIEISNGCTLIPFKIDVEQAVVSFTAFCK